LTSRFARRKKGSTGREQGNVTDETSDILELVAQGDAAALEAALEGGADAQARGRWGVSALAQAAAKGDLEAVELLLAHGAEVDRASEAGNSALMAAAARGRLEVVERLLEAGADPEHKNKWGLGAEDWAQWPDTAAEVRAVLGGARDA
jgi:ankyrin repeat protein